MRGCRHDTRPALSNTRALSEFLRSVEQRAYRRTLYTVREEDAALDIVQDAMTSLAQHYADRPAQEWPLLFHRILTNATMDWFRRRRTWETLFVHTGDLAEGSGAEGEEVLRLTVQALDEGRTGDLPALALERQQLLQVIEEALQRLPPRQREAFLLRYWEEFDVAQTAELMGCSTGSVKQHTFRAAQALARALRDRGLP
jgi:RNA polymerase sigma-70 factor (ECF subfamily)